MMLVAYLLAAATFSPPATNETFTALKSEADGPCHVKVEGKPAEDPPPACATAIAAATTPRQKAILYFAWAYSLNEVDGAREALPNLDKALELAPNFTNARHERAYTLNALGFYDRALIDANRDVELTPEAAASYTERAFARHRLGDFEGSLADRLKSADLEGTSPDRERAIADDLMWLARYQEAAKRLAAVPSNDDDKDMRVDLERRLAYRPDGKEADRCDMNQSMRDPGEAQKIVDACTWAFDQQKDRRRRADYLTVRAVMSVVAKQDSEANFTDLQIAVGLDPDNPDRHLNYGYALVNIRRSWAARNEFNIALSSPVLRTRSKAIALTGRGQANLNLGDLTAAKADAKASHELGPSPVNSWLIGDISFADGDKVAARTFWMAAYRMGARDDRLYANLKSVGVDDPEKEPK
jgi:tetratricopeptide (TPR) repeat protein